MRTIEQIDKAERVVLSKIGAKPQGLNAIAERAKLAKPYVQHALRSLVAKRRIRKTGKNRGAEYTSK